MMDPPSVSSGKREERRVLGFDVFSLDAASPRSSVDLDTWNGGERSSSSFFAEEDTFFPSPGLAWNSNAPTIKVLPNQLPAWFPWVPTKLQIASLKVIELKAACGQRGLPKVRDL